MDSRSLLAILVMAAATYATRFGGPWLLARLPPSARRDRLLRPLPGVILAAIVAPQALHQGIPGAAGAAVTLVVMVRSGRFPPAIVAGVATFFFLGAWW